MDKSNTDKKDWLALRSQEIRVFCRGNPDRGRRLIREIITRRALVRS